ncbi:hypothetical protein [Nocardioides sp. WS12]|uniref:hypothetical protein n=1 Tax=Nocardioides sp. WS12 TaxID=2486272 RepID=UPI0015FC1F79|nr:hypothetical protein [Nocardioides sp. WS12]
MDNENTPDQPAPTPDPEPPAPRWRDRLFQFRAVLAVALASVILGAGAGVLGTLVFGHDDDRPGRHERIERPGDRGNFPGPGGPSGGQNMPQDNATSSS